MDDLAGRFTWILVMASFGAFGFGWGTGANDVANAFGTSLGAKTLTMRQAILLAVVFEFTGAMVLGRVSAETVAGGIARVESFKSNAPSYAYGMSIVLWMGFLWQGLASSIGWNVSATHSIIGGIIGFAMVWGGPNSINWSENDASKVPPVQGVVPIVVAWVFSPIFTAIAAAMFYWLIKNFVLKSQHSEERAYYVLPIMVFFTVLIDLYFVFTKGAKKSFSQSDDWTDMKALWISACVAGGFSLLSGIVGIPWIRSKLKEKKMQDAYGKMKAKEAINPPESANSKDLALDTTGKPQAQTKPEQSLSAEFDFAVEIADVDSAPNPTESRQRLAAVGAPEIPAPEASVPGFWSCSFLFRFSSPRTEMQSFSSLKKTFFENIDYDIHQNVPKNPIVAAIHANVHAWDENTEHLFGYLQCVSAVCVMFAHGAGEVGYMAGPLAVVSDVVSSPANNIVVNGGKANPATWVIFIGALGLVLGLATFGHKVCEVMGTQITKITPSRGCAAELATSFVIMIAAQFGLPTSSSYCITGGIVGVALFDGLHAVNLQLLGRTILSWILTLLVMPISTALVFSQGVYSPSVFDEFAFSPRFGQSYLTICNKYANCQPGRFLHGCGLVSWSPEPNFTMGVCRDCADYAKENCRPNQFLSKCGGINSGRCTNCSSATPITLDQPKVVCSSGSWLSSCPGECLGS